MTEQRKQLFDGKDSTGSDIHPTYFEDPYFKTRASAQRYSDWKDRITPNAKRTKGVPNLFITGVYHDSLILSVMGNDITIGSGAGFSSSIDAKYSPKLLGLGTVYRQDYIVDFFRKLKEGIEQKTQLRFL